ncbi:radical SAM protein [Candidatus Woesearchaeota archaeon]|nr:radical SAM protein [Candidatus Woesearchaeota archaeon]
MVLQTETYTPKRIVHLNAELTRACNLRCNYCFNESGTRMSGELDQSKWQRVIDMSKMYGAESVLFTGGEVTARKDAPDIVRYALASGLRTSILTNGFHLRDHVYKGLIPSLERVQISLDSATPSFHNQKRGVGSWNMAREAIDYVCELDVAVEISATVSEDSLDELSGIADIAYQTNSKVLIRPIQWIGRANARERNDVQEAIEQRKKELEERVGNIFVEDFAKYVPVLGSNHDIIIREQGYITILPDGKIRGVREKNFELERAA